MNRAAVASFAGMAVSGLCARAHVTGWATNPARPPSGMVWNSFIGDGANLTIAMFQHGNP